MIHLDDWEFSLICNKTRVLCAKKSDLKTFHITGELMGISAPITSTGNVFPKDVLQQVKSAPVLF